MIKNKVVYVSSHKAPYFKTVVERVPTGETKKHLLLGELKLTKDVTKKKQFGHSMSKIDGERLATDIQLAIDKLNNEGYEVVCVSEVVSGNYDSQISQNGHGMFGGGGYGYSYTEGVNIIAKKTV